ncbi:hypothetical protein GOQ29_09655 [Clostridium sp. D2Q-14]|uniref:hypothetical protein n=1 Tax=Anaeromonas gelatinilytica TaxID=2683194 RepID=UPI00193B56A6|nr:hypothetical protein [Anaeromonas gelatinilytica]MBS4535879.1 hypothetical protein [Anaeromonas gelatinilytica]
MNKKTWTIVVAIVLIVGLFIGGRYILKDNIEVSKEKLEEYQEITRILDESVESYIKNSKSMGEVPILQQWAMLDEMYYKDILINPWSKEENERKDFRYKIRKMEEEKYETFLINDDNNKYVDKKTGEIKEIEEDDPKIILVK